MPKSYLELCILNFPAILLKLIDSGIHLEMQKKKLISSRDERKPLVILFFQNCLFRKDFWHIFWAMRKMHHTF